MSSSFTSEIMDDELNTILIELNPDDEHPRYTSLEGWSDLTPEAQNAVKLRKTGVKSVKKILTEEINDILTTNNNDLGKATGGGGGKNEKDSLKNTKILTLILP